MSWPLHHNTPLSPLSQAGIVIDDGPGNVGTGLVTWTSPDGQTGSAKAGAAPSARRCLLSTEEIEDRIDEYERARAERDFDECNKLRDSLFREGVTLNQKRNLWKAGDSRSGQLQLRR